MLTSAVRAGLRVGAVVLKIFVLFEHTYFTCFFTVFDHVYSYWHTYKYSFVATDFAILNYSKGRLQALCELAWGLVLCFEKKYIFWTWSHPTRFVLYLHMFNHIAKYCMNHVVQQRILQFGIAGQGDYERCANWLKVWSNDFCFIFHV